MDISSILNEGHVTREHISVPISGGSTDTPNNSGYSSEQLDPLAGFNENGAAAVSTDSDNSNATGSDDFDVTDPAKMDFIKTYTKEYDSLVDETTKAVKLILASIDKTVHDHTSDIDIPVEAIKFLSDKPKDNKVQKFDEAQKIVNLIMQKATQAKQQSEQAAMEASRIYDSIQQFKKDTNDEIAAIKNRDEFGRPIHDNASNGANDAETSAAA